MDIAKIRKKAKEEKEKTEAGSETPAPQKQPAEKTPEPSAPLKEETIVAPEPDRSLIAYEEAPNEESSSPETSPSKADVTASKPAAKQPETEETTEDIVELLTFQLFTEEFAFKVSDIEEILRAQQITPVPKMPDYILGITSLRGKIIPVIDIKKRLSIADSANLAVFHRKILILKGPKGPIGATIDKVKGVIRISPTEIVEPPAHLAEAEIIFLEGVVLHNSRFVSIIKKEEVLTLNLIVR